MAEIEEESSETEEAGGDKPEEILAFNQKVSSKLYLEEKAPPSRAFRVAEVFQAAGQNKKLIKAKKSDWVHNLIFLDGIRFGFEGRNYLRQIYDSNYRHKLLVFARQSEKSSMLASEFIVNSCIIPYFKTLYVAPSHDQTRQFSNAKLRQWIGESPVIQRYFQNTSTSQMVFERSFTNGSIGFLRSAFLTADRTRGISSDMLCIAGSSKVILEAGTQIQVDDFISSRPIGKRIWTLDEKTWQPEVDEVIGVAINGSKDTLKITTSTGSSVELTGDHKVLTFNGWKKAQELTTDDYLIEPEIIEAKASQEPLDITVTEDDCFIAGCLLGDGRHKDFSVVRFSTCDDILLKAFTDALKKVSADYTSHSYSKKSNLSGKDIVEHVVCLYGGVYGYKNRLEKLGVIGQETATKNISFFEYLRTDSQVAATLNGLIATDGYVCVMDQKERKASNRCYEIGFVSTSKFLADGVRLLFRRLGVNARLRDRPPTNGVSKKLQYVVSIRDTENFMKAAKFLNVPRKLAKEQFDKISADTIKYPKGNQVPIPNSEIQKRLKACGISKETYRLKSGSSFNSVSTGTNINKIRSAASMCDDKYIYNLANRKVIYTKVVSIVPAGEQLVYDITMKKNHNFFANLLCVHNCLDEIQDVHTANIPVMLETLSHSKHGLKLFSGTPKTLDNPIQQYWELSSQCEWLVPCLCHVPTHWNYLDERSIGKVGPICNKCGKPIDPQQGQWVSFSSNRDIMGFHVSQLMTPWFNNNHQKWKEILFKYETYAKGLFYNEVLGISYDSATKPVTRTDLIACCSSNHPMRNVPDLFTTGCDIFAGVDWGEGSDGSERSSKGRIKNASYTILSLGCYLTPKVFHVFFAKRYEGEMALPRNCLPDILGIMRMFGVKCAGVDWGFGWGVNDRVEEALGRDRVIKMQYVGMQKERKKYDPIGFKFQLNRTEVMTNFFDDIKAQNVIFPPWEVFKDILKDVENVYAEYSASSGNLKYDHKPSEPDDATHSMILCREAADNYYGKTR